MMKVWTISLVIGVFSNKYKEFLQGNKILWVRTSNICFVEVMREIAGTYFIALLLGLPSVTELKIFSCFY